MKDELEKLLPTGRDVFANCWVIGLIAWQISNLFEYNIDFGLLLKSDGSKF